MLFVEGLRLAIEMIDIAYARLEGILASISQLKTDSGQDLDSRYLLTASALLDAWSIVDSTDRARDLLEKFPGLSHKDSISPGRKFLLDRTKKIAELRNIAQHMRTDFYRVKLSPEHRAWGSLAWLCRVSENPVSYKSFLLQPGCSYGAPRFGLLGYLPALPAQPVARIILECRGVKANLSNTVGIVARIAARLEEAMLAAAPGAPRHSFDIMFHMDLHIDPTKPAGDDLMA